MREHLKLLPCIRTMLSSQEVTGYRVADNVMMPRSNWSLWGYIWDSYHVADYMFSSREVTGNYWLLLKWLPCSRTMFSGTMRLPFFYNPIFVHAVKQNYTIYIFLWMKERKNKQIDTFCDRESNNHCNLTYKHLHNVTADEPPICGGEKQRKYQQ